jgi:tetratricopeptide (TPR) repeat protein
LPWDRRVYWLAVCLAAPLTSWAQTPPDGASARLDALAARVMDPTAMLSVSATLAQLDEIEPQTAPGSVDRGRVANLRGLIEYKGHRVRPSIEHYTAALGIDAQTPFLNAQDRLMANYNIATQAESAGQCEQAVPYFRTVAALMAADPSQTEAKRLGVQERLGYCLHELKRYAEAQQVNQAVLAGGESLYGPNDPKLMTVLINLAQNDYELHQPDAARGLLQRVLAIATASGDADRVDTALFQLGVLAFESGSPGEATQLMTRRLQLAKTSGDPSRVHRAQEDLDILEEKAAGK